MQHSFCRQVSSGQNSLLVQQGPELLARGPRGCIISGKNAEHGVFIPRSAQAIPKRSCDTWDVHIFGCLEHYNLGRMRGDATPGIGGQERHSKPCLMRKMHTTTTADQEDTSISSH